MSRDDNACTTKMAPTDQDGDPRLPSSQGDPIFPSVALRCEDCSSRDSRNFPDLGICPYKILRIETTLFLNRFSLNVFETKRIDKQCIIAQVHSVRLPRS